MRFKRQWPELLGGVVLCLVLLSCVGNPDPAPESEAPGKEELFAGFLAKGMCSALWVNHREKDDWLARDVLLGRDELDRISLEVDESARMVTARLDKGPESRAVFHPTHGCSLLPEEAGDVSFNPAAVEPALPAAKDMDWPMGDRGVPALPDDIDAAALDAVVESAFQEDDATPIHTRALVVVHRGRLIAERYAEGFDQDSVLIGWSMGKSVTAALIGVAVQKGWLELEQPAPVAAWQTDGDPRGTVRIRDLLQMSSGLDCVRIEHNEPDFFSTGNDHFLVYFTAMDVFRFATDRELENPPGSVGRYRNCDPLSLGRILRQTTESQDESYLAFPQRKFFDRIGVRSMVLERDYLGNMILTGFDHGKPRDWARFGLLHLQEGVWMGERILPEGWVKFVSTPAPSWQDDNYGGLFWINGNDTLPGAPKETYYAAGAFGQFTIVVPSRDLVVVRMGYSANSGAVRRSVGQTVAELLEVISP